MSGGWFSGSTAKGIVNAIVNPIANVVDIGETGQKVQNTIFNPMANIEEYTAGDDSPGTSPPTTSTPSASAVEAARQKVLAEVMATRKRKGASISTGPRGILTPATTSKNEILG